MKSFFLYPLLITYIFSFFLFNCKAQELQTVKYIIHNSLLVRIAEIEIHPEYLEDYLAILKEESEASVRLEVGVICIYPMFQKENPTQIRLLEIYANKAAYEAHLQSPHFKHYKTTTLPMVKSLKLVEMQAIDPNCMNKIFKKLAKN